VVAWHHHHHIPGRTDMIQTNLIETSESAKMKCKSLPARRTDHWIMFGGCESEATCTASHHITMESDRGTEERRVVSYR
jgi:hypothetical protein